MTTSRRARAAGGRPRSVRVSLSIVEHEAVEAAAARQGLAAASWVGQVAVAEAEASAQASAQQPGAPAVPAWGSALRDLMMLRAELAEARRVLTNVGGNLNDVARHANTTGEIAAETQRVLGLVARSVGRVEDAVGHVDELAVLARRDRLRSGQNGGAGSRANGVAGGPSAGSGEGSGGSVRR